MNTTDSLVSLEDIKTKSKNEDLKIKVVEEVCQQLNSKLDLILEKIRIKKSKIA